MVAIIAGGCGGDGAGVPDATDTIDVEAVEADGADDIEADTSDAEIEVAIVVPADRAAGAREPMSARCDDSAPDRCFLPWPSSVFLLKDAETPTGLRLALAEDELPADEGIAALQGADGFSRVSPIVTLVPEGAAEPTMRLFVAEAGEAFAREVPITSRVVPGRDDDDRPTLVGHPLRPLAAASEHMVMVTAPGIAAPRPALLALGAVAPETQAEADRIAYFAPARAIVAEHGLEHVVAVWDFVTRSAEDPREPLRRIAADVKRQIDDGSAEITLGSVVPGEGPIALVVEGTIAGLLDHTTFGTFGDLYPAGPRHFEVPFRVVVPAGEGDYPLVMYGHGTGGNVHETSFDELIARSGAAKVNIEIDGWTADTVTSALGSLLIPIAGTRELTERMRRSIGGIAAIQRAVEGPVGDLLAGGTIGGIANPAAGRRPSLERPIWAGGSLGGVIGLVYSHLEPRIAGGILNVPGAAFTHWLAASSLGGILDIALKKRYPAMVDQQLAAAMAQGIWDEVDGAAWAGARELPPIFVVQMSVGDPVMPNLGTAMVATALDALQLVPDGQQPILPVPGLELAHEARGRSALTEFVTNETDNTAIHGFAARDGPAGLAARAQFEAFIATLWAGAPLIEIPAACEALPEPGICDFSAIP